MDKHVLNRTQNAKRNIVWGCINRAITIIVPFVTRTIVIYQLGINYVGLNSLFSSILSTLSLAELGFDTGIVTIMYGSIAKNDKKSICALLNFIKKAYLIVGIFILICGLLCIPFLNYLISDTSSIPDDINIYYLFLMFLTNTILTYFFGGYKTCVLEAYQRQDIISNISSLIKIVLFIAQVGVLIVTHNYYLYVAIIIISSLTQNIMVYIVSNRIFPDICPNGKIKNEDASRLKKILTGTFLQKIGAVMSVSVDNIVISTFLGITLLGYYSNYSYIVTAIQGFLIVIYSSMQGGIGNSVALESIEKNYSDLQKFTFGYAWVLGWSSICMLYLFSPFMKVWVGESGVFPTGVIILIVMCFYISQCFAILGTYKSAIGIWWEDRYRCIVGGIVNLFINVVMVVTLRKYDIYFALSGVIVSTILTTIFIQIPWAAKVTFQVYFKRNLKEYIQSLIKYFILTVINIVICYPFIKITDTVSENAAIIFVLRLFILLIVPNIMYWILYRKNSQYLLFKEFVIEKLVKRDEVKQ